MHSNIYEVSRQPIPESGYMTVDDLPMWFFSEIADYASEIAAERRSREIDWLNDGFYGLCTKNGDELVFNPGILGTFFLRKHSSFIESAAKLAGATYEAFIGGSGSDALAYTMFELRDAYDDRFGFYILDRDDGELKTLDSWLRSANLTRPWYVGGIIDYHW